ncbi:hypothetical protein [Hymenobacter metallilatus]|uniref:Uncharacterized protein n=1 Tax=Hymenobacter metallilatus TaxID=2493666 RepID=A0A3R9PCL0_9BACT|nr:hypothetical protein [Hymenobacter metallilatus]RSK33891.1 hypothetical protein EI290_09295 [Hymenobacter metallilatus]
MKQIVTLVGSALAALALSGCVTCAGDTEPCLDTDIPITSLEATYGCTNTPRQLSTSLNQTYTVIRNQADFDRLVTGSCHPQIDFTKYDLVIGNKGSMSGSSTISYTYLRQCETDKLILLVTFRAGLTNDAPILTYHALVPKLAPAETVEVKVEMKTN